mmetsp:Transcript_16769/g.37616  ORF Transcript_16769/g.37616 Transcript_16769/m.37616 type:complete len:90 (+) Transcript_16769:51-320(+)
MLYSLIPSNALLLDFDLPRLGTVASRTGQPGGPPRGDTLDRTERDGRRLLRGTSRRAGNPTDVGPRAARGGVVLMAPEDREAEFDTKIL